MDSRGSKQLKDYRYISTESKNSLDYHITERALELELWWRTLMV